MIVAGAKGLARELLEVFFQTGELSGLYFFDNVSDDVPDKLFNQFPVVRTFEDVRRIFGQTGDRGFALGLGNPVLRHRLWKQFTEAGGTLTSVVSPKTDIGHFGTIIGQGCCILPGVVITSNVTLGKGCLVNPNATLSHDSVLGDFVEVSPGVNVTGHCTVGDFSFLGANSVLLPGTTLGRNVVVGAGAVVTKDIPDNCVVAGVPAVIKRKIEPLTF